MWINIIRYFILAMGIVYLGLIGFVVFKHRSDVKKEKGNVFYLAVAEVVTWFLATFGVSDTALNMLFFRVKNTVDIKSLPSTIIVGATVPLCFMSYTYIGTTKVDSVTLFALVISQAIGSFCGAKIITRLDVDKMKFLMSIALFSSASLIFAKRFLFGIDGGNMIGLPMVPLIISIIVVFLLGALNMFGLGPTTPTIALLLLFGMNASAVYPIVMTANAIGCIVACISFIRAGNYHKKVSLITSIMGVVGVFLAVKLVKNMNLDVLQILMILILIYNAVTLMYTPKKTEKTNEVFNNLRMWRMCSSTILSSLLVASLKVMFSSVINIRC